MERNAVIYYAAFGLILAVPPVLALSMLAQVFLVADGRQPFGERLFQQDLSRAAPKDSASEVPVAQVASAVERGEAIVPAA
jgi:hypothetical protein